VFGDGGRHVGGVSELVSSFELICCADWCAHALARRASLHAPYRSLWLANKLTFGFLSKAKKDEKTPKVGSYFGYLGPSILLGHQGSENSQGTNRFLPRWSPLNKTLCSRTHLHTSSYNFIYDVRRISGKWPLRAEAWPIVSTRSDLGRVPSSKATSCSSMSSKKLGWATDLCLAETQFSPVSSSSRFNRQSLDDHEAFDIDSPVSVSGFLDFA